MYLMVICIKYFVYEKNFRRPLKISVKIITNLWYVISLENIRENNKFFKVRFETKEIFLQKKTMTMTT